jgi:hypothetical protein
MQAVFSVDPLRGYMTRPTEFCWASECCAADCSEPGDNGSGRICIAKIRYQETPSENTAQE